MQEVIQNGIILGIASIIIGNIVSYLMKMTKLFKVELPEICKTWNKYYSMEIALFFTGLFAYIFLEMSGVKSIGESLSEGLSELTFFK